MLLQYALQPQLEKENSRKNVKIGTNNKAFLHSLDNFHVSKIN